MDRLKALWARVQTTQVWRAWKRYGDARGSLLAGGITYFAFFSIFPALALAFTVFGVVLQGNPELLDQIKDSLNETLPGFIQDGNNGGLIPLEAPTAATLNITGLVGLGGLLYAGLGWLGALSGGIRAIFGVPGTPGNLVTGLLRDVGVLVLLGLAIVVSAAVTGVAGAATSWTADRIGLGDQAWLLTIVAFAVGAVLDGLVVLVMLRLLSGVEIPRRGLIGGAAVGGVGLTLLKVLGTSLIASTTSNPLFTSIALVVGLLAWLNFMSRIVLLAAAWTANSLPSDDLLSEGQQDKLVEGPAEAEHTEPLTAGPTAVAVSSGRHTDVVAPPSRTRADDRVTLALGATLGASVAAGLAGAARVLRRVLRRR